MIENNNNKLDTEKVASDVENVESQYTIEIKVNNEINNKN